MSNVVIPSDVVEGDIVRHLVNKKGRPLGAVDGYTTRGPVAEIRDASVTPYGTPGTYLRFEDNCEAGPFLPTDLLLLAND